MNHKKELITMEPMGRSGLGFRIRWAFASPEGPDKMYLHRMSEVGLVFCNPKHYCGSYTFPPPPPYTQLGPSGSVPDFGLG